MQQVIVQIKPSPGAVVEAKTTIEPAPAPELQTDAGKPPSEVEEPIERAALVHEGIPGTFTFDLEDGQKLTIETTHKANIVYDVDQCAAIHVPVDGPPEEDAEPPEAGPAYVTNPDLPPPGMEGNEGRMETKPSAQPQSSDVPPYTGDQALGDPAVNERIQNLR